MKPDFTALGNRLIKLCKSGHLEVFILGFPMGTLPRSRLCIELRDGGANSKAGKRETSDTVRCHIQQSCGMFERKKGERMNTDPVLGRKPSHLQIPQTPFLSPSQTTSLGS